MNKKIVLVIMVSAILSGCAYQQKKDEIDNSYANTETVIDKGLKSVVQPMPFTRPVVIRSQTKWFGGKPLPLAKEATLPAVFEKSVTLIFPGRLNLRTVSEKISKVTQVPVRLKPDVFMPTSMFIGGSGSSNSSSALANSTKQIALPLGPLATPESGPLPPAMINGLDQLPKQPIENEADEFELNYTGSLTELLNQVASRFSINWEYSETEGIVFSRLITQSFVIKANPGDSSFTASLGKGGGQEGSFSSDGQVKMTSSFSVWDGIQKTLDSIKSPVGKFHISQATGSVIITDTKDVIEIAKKIIYDENAMLTKQVAIRLEMYSVSSNEDVEAGVDWNVVYSKFSRLVPDFNVTMVSPSSLTTALSGSMGISIFSPTTSDGSAFNGTQGFIKALQGQGKVARMQSVSAMTLNRQPVPIGVTNQVSYLARTTPGSASGVAGVGSALPGLEPGQITTGFLVNLLPTVLDSNSVLLQFSIDLTELQKIGVISTGSGATQQSIQTPEVNGTQFVQRVALKAGSTLVLSGFERNRDDYDKRGITEAIGLGGSIIGKKNRESIVIMLTPIIVDGAN